jgi:hypothetical protein
MLARVLTAVIVVGLRPIVWAFQWWDERDYRRVQ